MKAVSVAEMRKLEQIAIEDYHTPALLLMENAATGFVQALRATFGAVENRVVHVFCAGGNNGGDGFAIARMLKNLNANVSITLLSEEYNIKGDAKTNFDIVKAMQIPFVPCTDCAKADIIVDGIFGTGFRGETTGDIALAIQAINRAPAFVASVDVPSGVSADDGTAAEHSVFCDLCVTFGAIKKGLLLFPGKAHYKTLIKTDISVPLAVRKHSVSGYTVIDQSVMSLLPTRRANSHKGSFGKATAFVGSVGLSGAAYLSASAILKVGAGMATAAIPEEIMMHLAPGFHTVMTLPLSSENASEKLTDYIKTQDVLLAGCGLGKSDFSKNTLLHLIKNIDKPMVIDADGLNLLSEQTDVLKNPHGPMIITPHVVEFSRLSGRSPAAIKENPVDAAVSFAQSYHVTVVLKDAVTVVAAPNGEVAISAGTNSGLATAGSGDVLSGIITGLLAQGMTTFDAAVLGVYLHLAAGTLAKNAYSEYGMTAENLLEMLPLTFLETVDISPDIKEL